MADSLITFSNLIFQIRAIFDHYYEVDQITRQERKNFFDDVILKMPFVKPVRIKSKNYFCDCVDVDFIDDLIMFCVRFDRSCWSV